MEPIEVKIACRPTADVSLDEVLDLQGNLKDLSEANYVKMRNSLVEYDFSFPLYIWIDPEGKKFIADGHQRTKVLKQMRAEGIVMPQLFPAYEVLAKDKIEAKKKLLLLNSRYGKMTREGYDEFIDDPDAKIIEEDLADLIEIPEIQMWDNNDTTDSPSSSSSPDDSGNPTKVRQMECPNCHTMINLFDKKE